MAAYTLERQHSPNQSSRAHYGYPPEPTGITIPLVGIDRTRNTPTSPTTSPDPTATPRLTLSARQVSLLRLVPDSRAAWHAGSTPGNGSTIEIECRPEMSAADWDTLVQLCTDLEEKHGSLKYYRA